MENYSTIVELLQYRASSQSQKMAYTFLEDGETETETLAYGELNRRSKAIAAQLQALNLRGERALLLYPSGLDYLAAFFGCLYAGVIAVPAYPPQNRRKTPRIKAIAADAEAKIVLTTNTLLFTMEYLFSKTENKSNLQWLTTDNLNRGIEDTWQELNLDKDTIAFLQYTSGSTGTPKGVMVSHGNLLHNAAMTYRWMEHSPESKFVSWLPIYHDMGLIGGILQPLYGGFPCILMPPVSFLQRPYRWLQAISRYGGTTSGAPNFAYELCSQKITAKQKARLDLSSWRVAFNGAEPIRSETLELFATTFAECGFRPSAFYPCYGMAETTLLVSGEDRDTELENTGYQTKAVDKSALAKDCIVEVLEEKDSQVFVGCGKCIRDLEVAIANPQTLALCQPNHVGEIWVRGDSVAKGYWNRPEETKSAFQARLIDDQENNFLRTGDLGFLDEEGELFITGRLKDLIIIRGRNLYPQDIELTAERSHNALRLGSNAAFTVEKNHEEKLVIVQELDFRAKPNLEEVIVTIRQAVTEVHEIEVYGVVLIKPGRIPKTSSGKIQRRATRQKFLASTLDIVASHILKSVGIKREVTRLERSQLLALSPREGQTLLEKYLVEQEAKVFGIEPENINSEEPLTILGLDSLKVFELKNQLEVDLKVEISVIDLFEGMSTRSLVTKILAQITADKQPSLPLARVESSISNHPLSFSQRGLWFIDRINPNTSTYNIPVTIYLHGCVDLAVLQECLNEIVRRHEILRTSFTMVDGQPVQVINQNVPLTLAVEDLRSIESDRIYALQNLTTELAHQPFDLSSKSLIRAKCVQIDNEDYHLIIVLHHIIADGWSIGILLEELVALYEQFAQGKPSPLSELPIQYKDFVNWQRKCLDSEHIQPSLAYWQQKLQGELPVLNLFTDRPRPSVQTFKGDRAKLVLDSALKQKLEDLSRQQGVTLFMTLLTAFKVLLYRYTGQTDLLVGSPIANRSKAEIEQLIGLFVNVLVLRTDLSGDLSFLDLLGRVKSTALEAYVHQDLPFEKLTEELQLNRDLSYNPLFQVMFVLQNVPKPNLSLSDVSISYEEGYNDTSKFDLTLFIEDSESGLVATCEYNTDLFDADTIARMLEHFQTLLGNIVSNPQQGISDLQLLTPFEVHQLSVEWNDTEIDYPQDKCIHQLFEKRVEKAPSDMAVIFDDRELTYQELNSRANQLAHYLQQIGVKPDVRVGICIDRSIEMVVGLLAIMKAGGAYIPLDPAYPQERIAFVLEDSQVSVLLTQASLVNDLPTHSTQLVCIDTDSAAFTDRSPENLVTNTNPENLAYLIYTSGSTGKPKGVQISHRAVVNFLTTMSQTPGLDKEDVLLSVTTLSFDIAGLEIYLPLIVGARLVLASQEIVSSGTQLLKQLVDRDITVMQATPATWRMLIAAGWSTENKIKVLCGGEALDSSLAHQLVERGKKVWNMYGPTETTIWSAVQRVTNEDLQQGICPIGHPIGNTEIYILDKHQNLVPVGVPGELHIAGAGLAQGYWNRPDLTTEKFIPSPFEPGKRLYKTGDLVRYRKDSKIEFLGRIDHQVKVRGFRIELGEIEVLLKQHPQVQETVVIARKDIANDSRIVAYIVTKENVTPSVNKLREFLRAKLPDYMLPSAFVVLDALPLTPNGKIDRRALPVPESLRPTLTTTYQAPQSKTEQQIAKLWQEVLHLEQVGIHDNFFDLGGHSLLLLEVNQKLKQSLQQDLSVVEMFQHPTIASLVQHITQNSQYQEAFQSIRDRTERRIKALNRQKQLVKNKK